MMNTLIKVLFILMPILCSGCVVSSQVVKITKVHAFLEVLVPGNPPADKNDLATSQRYFIYVEVPRETRPLVKKAWINKKTYNVFVSDLDTTAVSVVTDAWKNKTITIKAAKGKTLLLLNTDLSEDQRKMPAKYKNVKAGTVLLELFYRNKVSYFTIPNIVTLKQNPREVL